jgi:hypothetical protein
MAMQKQKQALQAAQTVQQVLSVWLLPAMQQSGAPAWVFA